jgi:protein-S-isoprenylcysteine O-methyltransferase Ste14
MYSGFFLFFIGMAFLLGSEVGLLLALVLIGMFIRRAVLEEQVLREELSGYNRYMAQVQHRFVPYVC